MEDE
jgi:hypothetical protein